MIVDSSHRYWFIVAGVLSVASTAGYLWYAHDAPDGLPAGSFVGLWYGIAGTAMFVFAGLLSALRCVPSWWWIGSRKLWLKGHIWLSPLGGVLVLCHSGFHWGGPIERALWITLGLLLVTGVYGLLLQQFLPRMMTTRVTCETLYEQISHVREVMRGKADSLVDEACGPLLQCAEAPAASNAGPGPRETVQRQFRDFYESEVRPFLLQNKTRGLLLASPIQAASAFTRLRGLFLAADPASDGKDASRDVLLKSLAKLETLCEERRQLAEQERLHHWLHAWLLLHVPLSMLLFLLIAVHAATAIYF